VEGNIGAGKSTFVQILRDSIACSDIVSEPVDEWKKIIDSDGTNIMHKFYSDIPRWAYTFQNLACITRMMKIESAINTSDAKFLFLDRSLGINTS
jgi:deoxycitidine kinase